MSHDEKLSALRDAVSARMSEKRYLHTLGVERAAARLGEVLLPGKVPQLRIAALLHDVTKEMPLDESIRLLAECHDMQGESILNSPQVLHSFTAPHVISRDFAEYATPEILSAVRKHTLGDPDMTVFDEIIFIADFIEDGRKYPPCIKIRDELFSSLFSSPESALHKACVSAIEATESSLIERGKRIEGISLMAKAALLARI